MELRRFYGAVEQCNQYIPAYGMVTALANLESRKDSGKSDYKAITVGKLLAMLTYVAEVYAQQLTLFQDRCHRA